MKKEKQENTGHLIISLGRYFDRLIHEKSFNKYLVPSQVIEWISKQLMHAKCKSGLSHSLAVSLFINSRIRNRMHILS